MIYSTISHTLSYSAYFCYIEEKKQLSMSYLDEMDRNLNLSNGTLNRDTGIPPAPVLAS